MTKEKIKFPSPLNNDFISELRARINDYFESNKISKNGNAKMVIKSIFMVVLYLLPYFLMIFGFINTLPAMIICWIIMGIGMAGVGMALMHDANHGTYTKNRKINSFLSNSLYLLGGYPANWQYQHNTLHHGFTNIDGHDDDINPIGLMRFSPHKPLLGIHKFQHFYAWFFYGLLTLSWTLNKDFHQVYNYGKMGADLKSNHSNFQLYSKLIVSKILYHTVFLVLPLVILPFSWYWIVLSFLAMHFFAGLLLSTIFQTAHIVPSSIFPLPDSGGNMENNWAIHQLMTTSDFSPKSKLFSWFIGGLNYQVEHHLFPNICHVHYPVISILVQETAQKYNLPYYVTPNFFMALHNHWKMLKVLGR